MLKRNPDTEEVSTANKKNVGLKVRSGQKNVIIGERSGDVVVYKDKSYNAARETTIIDKEGGDVILYKDRISRCVSIVHTACSNAADQTHYCCTTSESKSMALRAKH